MSETEKQLYEGLFLFDPATTTSVEAATEVLHRQLEHAGFELVTTNRWDERKLAYRIGSQKRGLYLLSYFKGDGAQVIDLERSVHLSEEVTRCLIIRADHVGDIEMKQILEDQQATRDAVALQKDTPKEEAAPAPEDLTKEEAAPSAPSA